MDLSGSRYDPDLEMFTDGPREPDLACLAFLRWLGEHGRLEHGMAGPPAGDYVERVVARSLGGWSGRP